MFFGERLQHVEERFQLIAIDLLDRSLQPGMENPYAASRGPIAHGAGDLVINLLDRVESRTPTGPFYELGSRCEELVRKYGYEPGVA